MQEIGRAGRDGAQSHAILLYNANDVASNRKYLKEEVREYCKLNSCRRAFISNHFGFTTQNPEFCHDCCDVCEKPCNCDICFEKFLMDMEDKVDECVSVSSADKQSDEQHTHFRISLANALSVYFKQENEGLGYSTAEIYTGLNEKLAKKLAEQMHSIASEDDILVLFPGINCKYISDLFTIIKHFNDMKLQTP